MSPRYLDRNARGTNGDESVGGSGVAYEGEVLVTALMQAFHVTAMEVIQHIGG